jgi:hypothetical protein
MVVPPKERAGDARRVRARRPAGHRPRRPLQLAALKSSSHSSSPRADADARSRGARRRERPSPARVAAAARAGGLRRGSRHPPKAEAEKPKREPDGRGAAPTTAPSRGRAAYPRVPASARLPIARSARRARATLAGRRAAAGGHGSSRGRGRSKPHGRAGGGRAERTRLRPRPERRTVARNVPSAASPARESISWAITYPARRARTDVIAPSPAPISSTRSRRETPASVTSSSASPLSRRKCCERAGRRACLAR